MGVGLAVPGQVHGQAQPVLHVGRPQRGAGFAGQVRGFAEVEGMRPQHHGAVAGQGLDEVLAAQRRKAAAHERGVGQAVVQGHLAQRITQPDVDVIRRSPAGRATHPLAAARDMQAAASQQRRHFVKALRMARHDQPLHGPACRPQRAQGGQQHGLLALAAAGQQHHRAGQAGLPLPGALQQRSVRTRIEFQVAEHAAHGRTQQAQAPGIVLGLRPGGGQGGIGRARQRRHAQRLAQRFVAEPRVGQRQRHALFAADGDQVGPHFGLHEHADRGPELLHEAAHGRWGIPGLPDLQVAGLQQPAAFGAARGRAMGQQQAHAGQALAQRGQQDGGSARLTQRYGMNPDPPAASVLPQRGRLVAAKALGNVLGIDGLGLGAAQQLAAQQRLRRPGHGAVQRARPGRGRA